MFDRWSIGIIEPTARRLHRPAKFFGKQPITSSQGTVSGEVFVGCLGHKPGKKGGSLQERSQGLQTLRLHQLLVTDQHSGEFGLGQSAPLGQVSLLLASRNLRTHRHRRFGRGRKQSVSVACACGGTINENASLRCRVVFHHDHFFCKFGHVASPPRGIGTTHGIKVLAFVRWTPGQHRHIDPFVFQ